MMVLAIVVAIGLVVFAVYRFSIVENAEPDDTVSKYLTCEATDVDNYALTQDMDEQNVDYEARMMFLDEQIYRANFVISKRFTDESATNLFTDNIIASYNNYVGKNGISKKMIISSVTNVDNIGKMVISIEGGNFTGKMAPLVMLDSASVDVGADEVQKYYERNGFKCSISEQDMVLSE